MANKWRGMKPTSYFEGLYRIVKSFPDHPDYTYWITRANEIAQSDYYYVMQNNGFHVVPQGYGPDQWNDMESVPTGWTLEANPNIWYFNGFFGSVALDALFLAKVTGDHSLEEVTAGSLGWLTGMHIGVASSFVTGTPPVEPISPGAFIINIPDRFVEPWSSWWWGPPSSNVQSVANGFVIINGEMIHQDTWESAETFIYPDGLFIHATALYEDYLLQTETCRQGLHARNENTLLDYPSLQAAYDAAETVAGHHLVTHKGTITGNIVFDRPISINITGGYNCDYTVIEGTTTIQGDMTISDGAVMIGGIILE